MKKKLRELLKKMDSEKIVLSYMGEYEISKRINDLFKDDDSKFLSNEEIAEMIAFDFSPDYKGDLNWGTYYGPKFILPDQTDRNKVIIYPYIKQVNENIINYWKKRAKKVKNLILKSRYADLVIDFSPKILNKRAEIDFYNIVINTNIEIVRQGLVEDLGAKLKLKRALELEIQTKKEISDDLKSQILILDKKGDFNKPGTWGFAFEWFLVDKRTSKKINLSKKEEKELISTILKKFKKSFENNPYILEYTTSLLADYYLKNNNEDSLLNILVEFEKNYKGFYQTADALSKAHAYERILEVYKKYAVNNFDKIKKEKERVIKEISQLNLNWENSLKKLSVSIEIPKKKIEQHLDFVFGKNREELIEKVVQKIVFLNLPKKEEFRKQYIELSSKYILSYLVSKHIISKEGYTIAKLENNIGNIQNINDDNRKFLYESGNYVQFGLLALSIDLEEFRKIFDKSVMYDYIIKQDLFNEINDKVIKEVLQFYYERNCFVCSHLLVPIIENIIRKFIRLNNGEWLKPNEYNGFTPLTLHQMLNSQLNQFIFKKVFGEQLGEDIVFYLKLSLTEKLGMGIRTDLTHGNHLEKFFNCQITDLLFHILLIFTLVKKVTNYENIHNRI